MKLTSEQKAKVGKKAAEDGIALTTCYYAKKFPLKESSVQTQRNQYTAKLRRKHEERSDDMTVKKLQEEKRGCQISMCPINMNHMTNISSADTMLWAWPNVCSADNKCYTCKTLFCDVSVKILPCENYLLYTKSLLSANFNFAFCFHPCLYSIQDLTFKFDSDIRVYSS